MATRASFGLRALCFLAALLAPWHRASSTRAATEYPDPYGCQTIAGRCAGDDGRYPVQYRSIFDGAADHYFLRFPDNYDPERAYPLMIHFHSYCAGDSSIGDPRLLRQVANHNQVIFVGHWQRGGAPGSGACGASFLGDGKKETATAAAAAREDLKELLNELVARFKISHVIAAGSSMGGYVALRLLALAPEKVHVCLSTAAALMPGHHIFPEPDHILTAARNGVYDDRFIYNVVGSLDESLPAHRTLNGIMQGKPFWVYREVAGAGHVNFFADDWNFARGHCADPNHADARCWYISSPDTPNLWEGIRRWEQAHPGVTGGLLEPDCGWQAPEELKDWYLTPALLAIGARPWPRPNPKCEPGSGNSGASPGDGDLSPPASPETLNDEGSCAIGGAPGSRGAPGGDRTAAALSLAALLVLLGRRWLSDRRAA